MMDGDFALRMRKLAEGARQLKDLTAGNEEATKTGLIMPFFEALGYNTHNLAEFYPEYTADVDGIKSGEKVDFAILENGVPTILIECKACGEKLDKHGSQLHRYFGVTAEARIGILTNGVVYRFFTDIGNANVMDDKPFLEVDLLDLKDREIEELNQFRKKEFDPQQAIEQAEALMYTGLFKNLLQDEMEEPTDGFMDFVLGEVHEGRRTANVKAKYRPLVRDAFQEIIRERARRLFDEKLEEERMPIKAMEAEPETRKNDDETAAVPAGPSDEQLEAFHVIRGILAEVVPGKDVCWRLAKTYLPILYKDKSNRWICRLYLDTGKKYIRVRVPSDANEDVRFDIDAIEDILKHRKELIASAKYWVDRERIS